MTLYLINTGSFTKPAVIDFRQLSIPSVGQLLKLFRYSLLREVDTNPGLFMNRVQIGVITVARFFLSSVFIVAAVNKIFHWHETERLFIQMVGEWQSHLFTIEFARHFFNYLILWAPALLIGATFMELIGGLMLLLGIREKIGAMILLSILIPSTILFHHFWFLDFEGRELQEIMFLKNLSIMGGLIMVAVFGAQSKEKGNEGYSESSYRFQ